MEPAVPAEPLMTHVSKSPLAVFSEANVVPVLTMRILLMRLLPSAAYFQAQKMPQGQKAEKRRAHGGKKEKNRKKQMRPKQNCSAPTDRHTFLSRPPNLRQRHRPGRTNLRTGGQNGFGNIVPRPAERRSDTGVESASMERGSEGNAQPLGGPHADSAEHTARRVEPEPPVPFLAHHNRVRTRERRLTRTRLGAQLAQTARVRFQTTALQTPPRLVDSRFARDFARVGRESALPFSPASDNNSSSDKPAIREWNVLPPFPDDGFPSGPSLAQTDAHGKRPVF
jgi:hypothetical protein